MSLPSADMNGLPIIPYKYNGTGRDTMPGAIYYDRYTTLKVCRKCGYRYASKTHKTKCREGQA